MILMSRNQKAPATLTILHEHTTPLKCTTRHDNNIIRKVTPIIPSC
uniref:Uncharacterized protein n=1 Tax=Arundo donax TaxID=35708 RepID=A0A0A8YC13_ARUDO